MNPLLVFLCGIGLLGLFFVYFSADTLKKKRNIGSLLALLIAAFFIAGISFLGLKMGIDLKGGSQFTVQLQPSEDEDGNTRPVSVDSVELAREILTERLNPDGAKDLRITPLDLDKISIKMPGIKDEEIDEVRKKIQQVAKLEFRLVHPENYSKLQEAQTTGLPEPGWTILPFKEDEDISSIEKEIMVKNRADLSGRYVSESFATSTAQGVVVILKFDSEGAKKFGDLTAANVGNRLAVVVDKEVVSAPNLNDAIYGGSAEISGNFTIAEARDLAGNLNNPLENPMQIIEERTTSPSYGQGVVRQGLAAGLVGLGLTLLFMLFYYRLPGIVALVGLALNVLLLLGAMSLFGFTLTMPGIAGIILTIGMAVDANVLIFERLREEMKSGKGLKAAIESAYGKAFSAIFDANVTTLITALILFILASDLIKGFAVTLCVGVLASLFAALVVTRVCFSWMTDTGVLKKVSMLQLMPEKVLEILGKRRIAYVVSAVLLCGALATMFMKREKALGVDFQGGDRVEISVGGGGLDEDKVRSALSAAGEGVGNFSVQSQDSAEQKFVIVQSDAGTSQAVEKTLRTSLAGEEGLSYKTSSVGPAVGKKLAKDSLIALGMGLLGILIYVTLRFEFSFAVGAILALVHDIIIVLGIVLLTGAQFSLIHVGAILTIAGYSINDTIVVFDRIREALRTETGSIKRVMNKAISQTLGRTILTSLTTLLMVGTLYAFGGPSLREFSFAIIIGVFVGTFSSIFVASPIVLWWSRRKKGTNLRKEVEEAHVDLNDPTVAT